MAKIIYKDNTFRIVDKNNLQYQLDIKNAKRDQIFTYEFLTAQEMKKLGYVWSEKCHRWLTTSNCIKVGKIA